MTTDTSTTSPRMFDHFRRPQSAGLGKLGMAGTLVLFAGSVVGILLVPIFGLVYGLGFGAIVAVFLLITSTTDRHGRTLASVAATWVTFQVAKRRGHTQYKAGPLSRLGTYPLPGVLAATELTEWEDSSGQPFALVATPQTGHYAVTFRCYLDGGSLVDNADRMAAVDRYGEWLAFLPTEPGCVQAMVVVETAPDSGSVLRRELTSRTSDKASDLARDVVAGIAADYPVGGADARAWVTLTFTGRRGRKATADDVAGQLAARLPKLREKLAGTGVAIVHNADAHTLTEAVRVAYDPAAADVIAENAAEGGPRWEMPWSSVGPAAAVTAWDHYRHDSGLSVTWSMSDVVGRVTDEGLAPILRPHPDVPHKRVALIYTVRDIGDGAQRVQKDLRAAELRRDSTRTPSARLNRAVTSAAATADEEANGHALTDFAVIVTATVRSADQLDDAVAAIDSVAPAARLLLRRENGTQAAAFAQGLPGVGLITSAHLRVPTILRESM